MRWLIRDRPSLRIVQHGITDERLAVAVRPREHSTGRGHQRRPGAVGRQRRANAIWGQRWFGDPAWRDGGVGDDPAGSSVHRAGWTVACRGRQGTVGGAEYGQCRCRKCRRHGDLFRGDGRRSQPRLAQRSAPSLRHHTVWNGRVELTSETEFTIGPGDVLLAEDETGTGHRWRLRRSALATGLCRHSQGLAKVMVLSH